MVKRQYWKEIPDLCICVLVFICECVCVCVNVCYWGLSDSIGRTLICKAIDWGWGLEFQSWEVLPSETLNRSCQTLSLTQWWQASLTLSGSNVHVVLLAIVSIYAFGILQCILSSSSLDLSNPASPQVMNGNFFKCLATMRSLLD